MYTLKKSLGQHFLKDENICRKIVEQLQKKSFSQLLEVGPGGGALTKYLLQIQNINFKTVELDEEKVNYLISIYPDLNSKIIHQNFLDIDIPFEGAFTVIGNFPYNISTQIMFKVLEHRADVSALVGMFQKEVAVRIAEKPGSKAYGILSVMLQAFYKIEYLFTVSEHVFNPPPKVKSAVIRLTRNTTDKLSCDEELFFKVVKASFNQRRKTVRNSVKVLSGNAPVDSIYLDKRAEQLSVSDFVALTNSIELAIKK